MIKANCPHVAPGSTGRASSLGIFLRYPIPSFKENYDHSKQLWLARQAGPKSEPGTSHLPAVNAGHKIARINHDLNYFGKGGKCYHLWNVSMIRVSLFNWKYINFIQMSIVLFKLSTLTLMFELLTLKVIIELLIFELNMNLFESNLKMCTNVKAIFKFI